MHEQNYRVYFMISKQY